MYYFRYSYYYNYYSVVSFIMLSSDYSVYFIFKINSIFVQIMTLKNCYNFTKH